MKTNFAVLSLLAVAALTGAGRAEPVATTGVPAAAYVQDGLLAHWDGLENAGALLHDDATNRWIDLSGNGHDLTIYHGQFKSNCFYCDGTGYNGVHGCAEASAAITTYLTVEATYKLTGSNNKQCIMAAGKQNRFLWEILATTPNQVQLAQNNPSVKLSDGYAMNTVAGTYASTSATTASAGYLNGAAASGTYNETWSVNPSVFTIGWGSNVGRAYMGNVYALRLYDRALTADEIAYNAMLDALRFGEENDRFRWNATTQKLEIYVDVTCLGASGSTVALNGGTAACSTGAWVEYGSTLSIAATPASGATLLCWYGGSPEESATAGTYTIAVKTTLSLSAVFGKDLKTWSGTSGARWGEDANWTPSGAPAAGDVAIVPASSSVLLDASTAALGLADISGKVVCTNWATCLEAEQIFVRKGATVTCAGPVTAAEDMSRVYLKGGELTVESGGVIDVSARGWRGGYSTTHKSGYGPGAVQINGACAGGSHGGSGSFSPSGLAKEIVATNTYGVASAPETAGSGGNGGRLSTNERGGNGGGVVRLEATGCVTVNGRVNANASAGVGANWGSGAGGSIYITCKTFSGAHGSLTADGAGAASYGSSWTSHAGGGGRLAIIFNTTEQAKASVPVDMTYSADCGAYHRVSLYDFPQAQLGTLYFSSDALIDPSGASLFGRLDFADVTDAWTVEDFRLTNGWATLAREGVAMHVTGNFEVTGKSLKTRRVASDDTTPLACQNGTRWDVGGATILVATNRYPWYTVSSAVPRLTVDGDLTVSSNGLLYAYAARDPLDASATSPALTNLGAKVAVGGALTLKSTGKVYCQAHPYGGTAPSFTAASLAVDATSYFNADDGGYFGGYNNNACPGVNKFSRSPSWPTVKCGASHGGAGGTCPSSTTAMGPTFEDPAWPLLPGPGGHGNYNCYAGRGGGAIRVIVTGDAVVDGSFSANATDGVVFCGSGAGGSILLSCRTLSGAGAFFANGGAGTYYSKSSTDGYNGGAGGGGRIAIHYDATKQGATCTATFKASGGAGGGDGVYSGNGEPGSVWFTDDKLIAGQTTFAHKGKIFCPAALATLSLPSLVVDNAFLDLAAGGGLDVTGDIVVKGTSKATCGINVPSGYLACGGNFVVTSATVTVTGGAPLTGNRLSVGGDLQLSGAALSLTHAETDGAAEATVGGTVTLTNSSTVTLTPPCVGVEGEPGLVFTAGRLDLFQSCWVYPYCHNTNGASVLFRIGRINLAAGGGFDACGKGYGRLTATGSQYGPLTTTFDGRGVDGDSGRNSYAAGHGGTGGLHQVVSKTYPKGKGLTYGDFMRPVFAGCGGAGTYNGSCIPHRGGGVVRIETDRMHLNGGSVLASAPAGSISFRTGASGGSVYIRAKRFFGEGGVVKATGGNGGGYGGTDGTHQAYSMAAGAGGRIAIWHGNPEAFVTNLTVSVAPGVCSVNQTLYPVDWTNRSATAGTVFFRRTYSLHVIVQ